MLELQNISKVFWENSKSIFTNLNFVFPNTGLFILKGKNGVGKSTLLSILSGQDSHYE